MRLDKFLKTSRLVKRRTVANALCKAGKVFVNSRPAKPGHEVEPGDVISISTATKSTTIKILENWLYEAVNEQ